eukprot:TRINITY_DN678_c0_g1_i1.p1 TRINITY_DN678_c0_g1~~TRINITY_DN678_c0_g1_i1.p1  ORF type:complete len:418 (-),score=102.87 TRINITY_DN678_c0_g1_i1:170-1387(-)
MASFAFFLLALACLAAASSAKPELNDVNWAKVRADIGATLTSLTTSLNAGDYATAATLFSPTATLVPPSSPAVDVSLSPTAVTSFLEDLMPVGSTMSLFIARFVPAFNIGAKSSFTILTQLSIMGVLGKGTPFVGKAFVIFEGASTLPFAGSELEGNSFLGDPKPPAAWQISFFLWSSSSKASISQGLPAAGDVESAFGPSGESVPLKSSLNLPLLVESSISSLLQAIVIGDVVTARTLLNGTVTLLEPNVMPKVLSTSLDQELALQDVSGLVVSAAVDSLLPLLFGKSKISGSAMNDGHYGAVVQSTFAAGDLIKGTSKKGTAITVWVLAKLGSSEAAGHGSSSSSSSEKAHPTLKDTYVAKLALVAWNYDASDKPAASPIPLSFTFASSGYRRGVSDSFLNDQ